MNLSSDTFGCRCNAASNHILMQELNVTSDAEDDVTVIGLAAEAVQYAERVCSFIIWQLEFPFSSGLYQSLANVN